MQLIHNIYAFIIYCSGCREIDTRKRTYIICYNIIYSCEDNNDIVLTLSTVFGLEYGIVVLSLMICACVQFTYTYIHYYMRDVRVLHIMCYWGGRAKDLRLKQSLNGNKEITHAKLLAIGMARERGMIDGPLVCNTSTASPRARRTATNETDVLAL